jgi:hypothetical protein
MRLETQAFTDVAATERQATYILPREPNQGIIFKLENMASTALDSVLRLFTVPVDGKKPRRRDKVRRKRCRLPRPFYAKCKFPACKSKRQNGMRSCARVCGTCAARWREQGLAGGDYASSLKYRRLVSDPQVGATVTRRAYPG